MPDRRGHALAALIALLGWTALALQLYLIVRLNIDQGHSGWRGVGRFFGYFTILTNILVALVITVRLRGARAGWLSTTSAAAATASYIALVALVYEAFLRRLWAPAGLQWWADVILHTAVPILYVVYWATFVEKGTLAWRAISGWLVYPLGYLVYALARGAIEGWYPYPFIDAIQLGYGRVVANAVGLVAAWASVGAAFVAFDRWAARVAPRL